MCRLQLAGMRKINSAGFFKTLESWLKLAGRSIRGTDLLFGSEPEFSPSGNKVICVGDCTKKFASTNNYEHIPGCPPSYDDIIRKM